ncbi:Xaa-Pro peptidase family protein [Mesorhizobium sp.]|uniref:M24 family metallopeptidase n=1 Tax=Mesorhizobium sp. TaxID=1871066 RepID=UPI000FE62456|nr:Xaa-Pro peptidase family protein [Mesorhizobium sp.]RWK43088.1 MAG: aminopeptidase P family protein [Mesorhizobium sp.]RWK67997.1 MAG: aminopeptidase P family protein [Mesorhizobium sp.]RWK73860.1 MAG: aminopeptidase P family protein [Mesorhizobium sp.]RWK81109.1 MAG: aminopeptidase P family protein [Mesorhizobium sp.]RWL08431.1 MAG: aminopeptidase P family protein [Mesorhizobium sp.]
MKQDQNNARILAGINRAKLVASLGGPDLLVVATSPHDVFYCSGYKSMGFDTNPQQRMAVVFHEEDWVLVGPMADCWCAAEAIGSGIRYFGYGTFYFDDREAMKQPDIHVENFRTFDEAVLQAAACLGRTKRRIVTDALTSLPDAFVRLYAEVQQSPESFTRCRAIKHPLEVAFLRTASIGTEKALSLALAQARAGMTEIDVAASITFEIMRAGLTPGFIVVTSGPRAALADAYPTTRVLNPGDVVRIDIGGTFHGYWSDTARTAVVGEPSSGLTTVFRATAVGLETARRLARPGVMTDGLFREAVAAVCAAGLPDYRRHHVGHGLGIESHEYPTIGPSAGICLEAGMVINLETPYYRPMWGGVMIEDTLLITDDDAEPLTELDRGMFIIAG